MTSAAAATSPTQAPALVASVSNVLSGDRAGGADSNSPHDKTVVTPSRFARAQQYFTAPSNWDHYILQLLIGRYHSWNHFTVKHLIVFVCAVTATLYVYIMISRFKAVRFGKYLNKIAPILFPMTQDGLPLNGFVSMIATVNATTAIRAARLLFPAPLQPDTAGAPAVKHSKEYANSYISSQTQSTLSGAGSVVSDAGDKQGARGRGSHSNNNSAAAAAAVAAETAAVAVFAGNRTVSIPVWATLAPYASITTLYNTHNAAYSSSVDSVSNNKHIPSHSRLQSQLLTSEQHLPQCGAAGAATLTANASAGVAALPEATVPVAAVVAAAAAPVVAQVLSLRISLLNLCQFNQNVHFLILYCACI